MGIRLFSNSNVIYMVSRLEQCLSLLQTFSHFRVIVSVIITEHSFCVVGGEERREYFISGLKLTESLSCLRIHVSCQLFKVGMHP